MNSVPDLAFISGGLAVDDRGSLTFCNDFDLASAGIHRFYMVSNHEARFVRAWHGHKQETKFVVALSGAAVVAAVKIDDWNNPAADLEIKRFVISAEKPGLLRIPGGHAHGTMTLVPGTKLLFLSTATLQESSNDDFRFDAFRWNPWDIVPR